MAKFEEFSSGISELFDTKARELKAGEIIRSGQYAGLPLVIVDGVKGVDIFGRFYKL